MSAHTPALVPPARCVAAGLAALWLAACAGTSTSSSTATATVPGAPTIVTVTAGDGSASVSFTAPSNDGGSALTGETATCTASGHSSQAQAASSPITVTGLTDGTTYQCTVSATNAAGTGPASAAVSVTPVAAAANPYAAVYRTLAWSAAVAVTYSGECSMSLSTTGVPPYHADYYLAPVSSAYPTAVAETPVSHTQMSVVPYTPGSISGAVATLAICPTKAATTTATSMGAIGYTLSGEALFNAFEGNGAQTPAMSDNVSYTFTDSAGVSQTASFIDACNSHPTPLSAGYDWHHHGLPTCLVQSLDGADGPSHLLGIALDGFPIYGGRDIHGAVIDVSALDACNGITSPTPEFPGGAYHYVLPIGVTGKQSSLNCFSGTVTTMQLALARGAGCRAPRVALLDRPAPARRRPSAGGASAAAS